MKDKKPTVFLDIDGVLANDWSLSVPGGKWHKKYGYPFAPECVEAFNEFLRLSKAEIVLSSDWRRSNTLSDMREIFSLYNVYKAPIDFTECLSDRDFEIEEYVFRHKLTNFVIIDDLPLECFPHNFVHIVDDAIGLTQEHVQKALRILGIKPYFDPEQHKALRQKQIAYLEEKRFLMKFFNKE